MERKNMIDMKKLMLLCAVPTSQSNDEEKKPEVKDKGKFKHFTYGRINFAKE